MGAPRRLIVITAMLTAITYAAAGVAMVAFWRLREISRPPVSLALMTGPQSTVVLDRDDRPVFRFYTEDRTDVAFDHISPYVIDAILAVEDKRFYMHRGLDPIRMAKAAAANVRARRIVQGGSTITQQLARSMLLSSTRTYGRKLREVFLATEIEARYDKRAILEAYLNRIYFGNGYYGVEAASRGYFAKPASEVTAAEAALLAGLVKSPMRYSPAASPARARARRDLVLRRMRDQDRLAEAPFEHALATPVRVLARRAEDLHREAGDSDAAEPCGLYFKEEIRRALTARVGTEQLLGGGLRVYTTIDMKLQCEAERVINQRLAELRRMTRHGNDPANPLQGSLVTIDPRTGFVLAMVGGSDFHQHRYNRATQARRQPGSAFKPFVFAAAVERGYMPFSVIGNLDRPIDVDANHAGRRSWLPSGEHEASQYTLRRALRVSSNRASAQLMQEVGVSQTIALSHRLGIESPLPAVPSLALGTGEVTLVELTTAFGAFANQGFFAPATTIRRIEDRYGATIWHNDAAPRRALSGATAFLVTSMLQDVVSGGTAAGARAFGFVKPAAGKTGTTDSFADTWFIGFTPRLVTGVWFGFDRPKPIMVKGFAGTVAVPAWARFMRMATAGDPPDTFHQPADVERVAICRLSGMRAGDGCRYAATYVDSGAEVDDEGAPIVRMPAVGGVYEDFAAAGSVPYETCLVHSAVTSTLTSGSPDEFLNPPRDLKAPTEATMRLVVEHARLPDGSVRTVIRQVPIAGGGQPPIIR